MSFESEKGVIGCILMDSGTLFNCQELKANMFSEKILGLIYYRAQGLYDNMKSANVTELVLACKSEKLDENTIRTCLRECILSVSTSQEIKSYVKLTIDDYKCKETKRYLEGIHEKIFPASVTDSLRDINAFTEAMLSNDKPEYSGAKELSEEFKSKRFCTREKERVSIGIESIDYLTGGLEGGDVTVIGARPSVGKTALATQMVSYACSCKKHVGYYSLEMSKSQVYDRFISLLSGIDLGHLRNATSFLNDDYDRFNRANVIFSDYKLDIVTSKTKVSDIMMSARHRGYDLIVVDYLQLIKPEKNYSGNKTAEVGTISRALKELSTALDVPVILLSQLNRASELRDTKEPTMADLRESGDIEQDASIIILMWNTSEDRTHKGAKLEKNRNGKLGKVNLDFDGDHMKFVESETEWHETDKGTSEPSFQ